MDWLGRDYSHPAIREMFTPSGLRADVVRARSLRSLWVACSRTEGAHHVQPFQSVIKKDPGGSFFISGGEGGIRTLDGGYLYTLSRRAPSTARTPLRNFCL